MYVSKCHVQPRYYAFSLEPLILHAPVISFAKHRKNKKETSLTWFFFFFQIWIFYFVFVCFFKFLFSFTQSLASFSLTEKKRESEKERNSTSISYSRCISSRHFCFIEIIFDIQMLDSCVTGLFFLSLRFRYCLILFFFLEKILKLVYRNVRKSITIAIRVSQKMLDNFMSPLRWSKNEVKKKASNDNLDPEFE